MPPYSLDEGYIFLLQNILVVVHCVSMLIRKARQAEYAFSFLVFYMYTFFPLSASC